MLTPLIGITTYGQDEEKKFPLPREYVDAVRRGGGTPLLLPPGETNIERLLLGLDGLILAGGGDVHPRTYGGDPHDTVYMADLERDTTEIALTRRAIASGHPTFGICRGLQIINVALGGTLHQHLPEVVGETVKHRLPPREPTGHVVKVQSNSRLSTIMLGDTVETAEAKNNRRHNFNIASWHHQAIRDLAVGLKVVAHAADGTIEAVEMVDHRWLIGVQWHPEMTAGGDEHQQRLFDEFIRACRT